MRWGVSIVWVQKGWVVTSLDGPVRRLDLGHCCVAVDVAPGLYVCFGRVETEGAVLVKSESS